MTPHHLIIVAIVCVAGFIQGASGFGFGLTAMPLLALLMEYKEATMLVFLLSIVVSGITFLRNRAHYDWRQGWELIAGAVVGLPIGLYLLIHVDVVILRHLLGLAMILFAINEFVLKRESVTSKPLVARLGFPLGILSGGLDAAFNMGGPPAVAYVYSRKWSAQQIAASLQVLFGVGLSLRMILILCGRPGLLNAHVLRIGAWALIPLSLCILLATHFARRLPHAAMRRAVFIFLGAMGIKYLLLG